MNMEFNNILLILFISLLTNIRGIFNKSVKSVSDEFPVVCYKDGCVRGKSFAGYRKPFEGFYGIPFAKPPVGNLRLRNPEPVDSWNGILNATDEKPICIQKNFLVPNPTIQGVEDCLYLYVYRPKNINYSQQKLPVMIYIHGGAFFAGAGGPSISGGDYFMDHGDIIMVAMQYRLGPLGFISTGDNEISGNFGLKDQALAIKWVHENIEKFGGNPNVVTLWGQSAGAASVNMHMMSPLTKNLFHRAIMLSGSAIAPYNYPLKDPLYQAIQYAYAAGLSIGSPRNTTELANAFRSANVNDIINASEKLKFWSVDPLTLNRVVVENCEYDTNRRTQGFLCKDPVEMWKNGEYTRMPMMASHVPQEGAVRALQILINATELNDLNNRFNELIPKLMEVNTSNVEENIFIANQIRERYLAPSTGISLEEYQKFFNIYTDRSFLVPLYQMINQHNKQRDIVKAPFFLFKFSFPGPLSYSIAFSGTFNDYGVVHCDELIYLLKTPAFFPEFDLNSTEARMRTILVHHLVSFAYHGQLFYHQPIVRSPMRSTHQKYLNFTRQNKTSTEILFKTTNNLSSSTVKFWMKMEGRPNNNKIFETTRTPEVIAVHN